jgi:hypothetical protein
MTPLEIKREQNMRAMGGIRLIMSKTRGADLSGQRKKNTGNSNRNGI